MFFLFFLVLPRKNKKTKKTKVLTPCQTLGHRFCHFAFFVFFGFTSKKQKKTKKTKVLTPCQTLGHRFCHFVFFCFFLFYLEKPKKTKKTKVLTPCQTLGHRFCHFGFFVFFGFTSKNQKKQKKNKSTDRDGCTADTGMCSSAFASLKTLKKAHSHSVLFCKKNRSIQSKKSPFCAVFPSRPTLCRLLLAIETTRRWPRSHRISKKLLKRMF